MINDANITVVDGNSCIVFKTYGLFYKFIGKDALIMNYLFNIKIKDNTVFLIKERINEVLKKLDELNIDYCINGIIHNFIVNNYNKYLEYSKKKESINKLYNKLISEIEND